MGLENEIFIGRTLAWQGLRHVEIVVQRLAATTHRVTVQPYVNADGRLGSPLLVCFNERSPPQSFFEQLAGFKNLRCINSSSGKLDSDKEADWIHRFAREVPQGSLLLLDAWSGYKAPLKERELVDKEIEVRVLPAGSTPYIQPLDVGFNLQFKQFIKSLSQKIRRRNPDFILAQRVNQAALIDLTQRQFSSPRFMDFIRYAWYKSGYYGDHPAAYLTPNQYCLKDYPANSRCKCGELCFIRCAFCTDFLCFGHAILVGKKGSISTHQCDPKPYK
jgi:hypothetical protein